MLIIFDLDQTLINSTIYETDYDITIEYLSRVIYVKKRPNVDKMLRLLSEKNDIAIWSKADEEYVNKIISACFSDINFMFIWNKTMCNGFTKPLQYVYDNYNLSEKNVILLDDDIPNNVITITKYLGNNTDDLCEKIMSQSFV